MPRCPSCCSRPTAVLVLALAWSGAGAAHALAAAPPRASGGAIAPVAVERAGRPGFAPASALAPSALRPIDSAIAPGSLDPWGRVSAGTLRASVALEPRRLRRLSVARGAAPAVAAKPPATLDGYYETIGDGAGGFYVAWTDFGFRSPGANLSNVYVQRFDANGDVVSGWPARGLKVADHAGIEDNPLLEPDGAGGVLVAYDAYESGYAVPMAQRISSAGVRQWGSAGVTLRSVGHFCYVFDALPDGAGGLYVSWEDAGANLAVDVHSSVQHVDGTGALVSGWAADGINMAATTGSQTTPDLYTDVAGGAFVVWADSRSGADKLYGQHLTAAGVKTWSSADGLQLTDVPLEGRGIADYAGGFIYTWSAFSTTTSSFDIYVQRYDGTGAPQLASGGAVVCDDPNLQINPAIAPDGAGGAVVTWMDARDLFSYLPLYALRVDAGGGTHAGWPANGIRITDSEPYAHASWSDGGGGAFVYWSVANGAGSYDLNVQHVTGAGALQTGWALAGVTLTTAGAKPDPISFSGTLNAIGGVHATWQDSRVSATSKDYFGQSLDLSGALKWTLGGKALTSELGRQSVPSFASESGGGLGVRWQDKRSGQWGIWGRSLSSSGLPLGASYPYSLGLDDRTWPQTIGDGAGGTINAWSLFKGPGWDTYLQRTSAGGSTQWAAGGLKILSGSLSTEAPLLLSDRSGGAIVGQQDSSGAYFRLQRVNAAGTSLWTPGGVGIDPLSLPSANVAGDGAHGVHYVFNTVVFDSASVTYYSDLHVNRVDSTGAFPWGALGKAFALPPNDRYSPIVECDDSCGMFIFWLEGDFFTNVKLVVQHLGCDGNVAAGWPAAGVPIRSISSGRAIPISVTSDGAGGVFVGWWDFRAGVVQSYMQHVNSVGSALWTPDGNRVSNAGGPQLLFGLSARLGSPIAGWLDGRGSSWDVYAQKFDGAGAWRWATDGFQVCGAGDTQGSACLRGDGAGGAYVVWQDARTWPDFIYAQHVTSGGFADWSTDGVVAVLASLVSATAADGAAQLEWRVAPLAGVTVERSNDGVSWTARATLAADGEGDVRFADAGLTPGRRYGWRLALATPGGIARAGETWLDVPRALELALGGARPNPASDRLIVTFVLPSRASARLELLDVAGRRVRTREVGALGPGAHVVDLGASGLGPGVYLLRLTQGARSVTARVTLLR